MLFIKRLVQQIATLCNTPPPNPMLCFLSLRPTTHRYIGLSSFFSPPSFPQAPVLLRFNLADTISSYCLMPCTISIWYCDIILPILLYDTHLRATHTTTGSIGGVQIPIYLVSSTTDSLWQSAVVLKLYQ